MTEGNEYYLSGGLYDPKGEDRTDVYVEEQPIMMVAGIEKPATLQIIFCNGNLHFSIVELLPKDVVRLGKFLEEVAKGSEEKE